MSWDFFIPSGTLSKQGRMALSTEGNESCYNHFHKKERSSQCNQENALFYNSLSGRRLKPTVSAPG